jgi:hypothetical protein
LPVFQRKNVIRSQGHRIGPESQHHSLENAQVEDERGFMGREVDVEAMAFFVEL